MASTYSTSLKIQLMGNGEDSGTWGSITNTNWNLIEQAVAGVQNITMANSNYTLTNLNGVSDEARNMVLVVGGTNSAIYQIIAPLAPKFYVVSNQTVGGYAITIGGSSGALITIPNGSTAQVYCNGTGFFSAQTSSAGNFNVNGNLSVTGTSTLTGAVAAGSTLSTAGLLTASAGIAATTGNFSGNLASLGSVSGASGIFGAVSGTTGTFSSTVSGTTITASTQFSGPGTGLTGTASSLTVGAATNATNVVSGGTIASNVTGTTQALGTNNTTIATTAFALANGIPSGAIVMWSGSIASIPSGWLLCNGASGTPDLRDRFVVGAGSTYAVAATGGSANATLVSHTHTAAVADPGHLHSVSGLSQQNRNFSAFGSETGPYTTGNTNTAVTNISVTNSTEGSSATNANLPPYYALAYIMKA
jgi:hypothetical protein